jgi:colanic acid/amylovoran biosynthesis glycosyltransferase
VASNFPAISQTYILNQITGLIDRGHEVDVYASQADGRAVHANVTAYDLLSRTVYWGPPSGLADRVVRVGRFLAQHGWRHPEVVIKSMMMAYGRSASRLYCAATHLPPRCEYDVIHCHFGQNGLKALFLRDVGAWSGRMVTTFHGSDVFVYPHKFGMNCYQELFERCEAYTVNTEFTKQCVVDLGCPAHRIESLPVGLDLTRFAFQGTSPAAQGQLRLVTVGNLIECKGIEFGIRAVARLSKDLTAVHYEIVGDGPLRQSLEALVDELDVRDRVTFLGAQPIERVQQAYCDADVFVLPGVIASDGSREAQGLVLGEAQASGLPIVATTVGGIPQAVHQESAILVPERNVEALVAALKSLADDPARRVEMGRAGRQFVEQEFDIECLNDKLVHLYERLVADRC